MSLLCEIQGAFSNIVLVDQSHKTLLAARQIGTHQTSVRAIRVGAPYVPPPNPGAPPVIAAGTTEIIAGNQVHQHTESLRVWRE